MSKYTVREIEGHNPWLTRELPNRHSRIVGVMLHATRSGSRDPDYDDAAGTENWAQSPANGSAQQGWGSYWDLLVARSDGERIVSTDWDHEYASWTAGYGETGTWAAGIPYVQLELAQARIDQPFTDVQIDSAAEAVGELARKYGFALRRIAFLEQRGPAPEGICTHEDSANGRKLGKSDPGPLFPWKRFMRLANEYAGRAEPIEEEPEMSEERIREIVDERIQELMANEKLFDVRLRRAQRAQDQLVHLASDEDPDLQIRAVEILKQEGFEL